ncbi:helix-turn-helix domain-containing protein [Puia dinghuensis]|uniref:AraC family transcriptional regulator n=1 Tax=Puia dinghuensis TaxID=1792502 RepID=A0A8J2UH07_9BACT|nr:helix-turn-helix domain-containing protein [Puia dinghuensis]GGB15651.1 AraC family transcriptional regulator [Puia dinghuensis]
MDQLIKIFTVGPAESEKIAHSVNEPHNHDFEELIVGKAGQLEHFIDFRSQLMDAPFVSFVTRGKIHRLQPLPKDGRCDMWVIRFKSEFVPEMAFQLYASFHNDGHIGMQPDFRFERLDVLCRLIFQEYQQPSPDYSVMRQLLTTLLTIIESERRKQGPDEAKKTQNTTFINFLRLLEEHYKTNESVGFYAEKLFMTPRNLNLICQKILHQSVSEIIETRCLIEAKNMLVTTSLTVSEIAYQLGFKEKTYFTHIFKKKAGLTPTEFREEMARLIS